MWLVRGSAFLVSSQAQIMLTFFFIFLLSLIEIYKTIVIIFVLVSTDIIWALFYWSLMLYDLWTNFFHNCGIVVWIAIVLTLILLNILLDDWTVPRPFWLSILLSQNIASRSLFLTIILKWYHFCAFWRNHTVDSQY